MIVRRFMLVGVALLSAVAFTSGTVASAAPSAVAAASPTRYLLTAAEMGKLMNVEESLPKKEATESNKSGKIVLYSGTNSIDGSVAVGAVGVLNVPSKNWLSGVRKFAKKEGFVETYSTKSVWEGTYTSGSVTLYVNFLNAGDNITVLGMAGGDGYGNPMMVARSIALAQELKLAKNGWGSLS